VTDTDDRTAELERELRARGQEPLRAFYVQLTDDTMAKLGIGKAPSKKSGEKKGGKK
jgi:hypothetical protein